MPESITPKSQAQTVNTPPEGAFAVGKPGSNMLALVMPGGFHALCWDPDFTPEVSGSGKSLNVAVLGRPTMIFPGETANNTVYRDNPNRDVDVPIKAAENAAKAAAKKAAK